MLATQSARSVCNEFTLRHWVHLNEIFNWITDDDVVVVVAAAAAAATIVAADAAINVINNGDCIVQFYIICKWGNCFCLVVFNVSQ